MGRRTLPNHMYADETTPLEEHIKKTIKVESARAKMWNDLNKYGRKDAAGGRVWTVGDMQKYFRDSDAKKRKKKG